MTSAIAARTEHEAFEHYSEPIKQAIACFVPNAHLIRIPDERKRHGVLQLTFSEDAIGLRDASHTPCLALALTLSYRTALLPAAKGRPKRFAVQTVEYVYRLEDVTDPRQELIGYHWHPDDTDAKGVSFPHVHPYFAGGEAGRRHIAVSHATLHEVLTTAMREFRVQPVKRDWERPLHEAAVVLRASLEWATA